MLAEADRQGDATPFIEFVLTALRSALGEAVATDPVTDQVSDQVIRLLKMLQHGDAGAAELMARLGLTHRPTYRTNYLAPALAEGWVERTLPDSPRSPTQKYRLTEKGRGVLARRGKK